MAYVMQRRKTVRQRIVLDIVICLLLLISVCGSEEIFHDKNNSDDKNDFQQNQQESGLQAEIITMAGSTSMEKLATALAESFMEKYPYVTVTTEFTGSSAGIESMLAGSVHIGNSSRALTRQEQAAGAVGNIVAIEGIAVITDTANVVTALTTEQLADIYAGRARNWSELGGADVPIVVVGREAGSGTRETFERQLGMKDRCIYANELDSAGAVLARVASTPGAVGYVSRDVLSDMVQTLSINGFEATDHNILEGRYPLSRPLIMATKGEIAAQEPAVRLLFAYLRSEEGKSLIESVGLIVPESGVIQ